MRIFYFALFLSIFLSIQCKMEAQRYFVTNLYAYDLYTINPAAASIKSDCFFINAYAQKQWFGTDNAPTTQILSYYQGFHNDLGVGAYIYNDANGYTRDQGGQITGAYAVTLFETTRKTGHLLFGMSGIINNKSIDMSVLDGSANFDPSLNGKTSGIGYNANAGIMLIVNSYQLGFSATNMLPTRNSLYSQQEEPTTHMDLNFYSSILFKVPEIDLFIEPQLFYRRNNYLDSRADLNVKLTAPTSMESLILWGLVGYRHNTYEIENSSSGVAATLGVVWNNINVGLEYQFGLTGARQTYGNAYQLIIGYSHCMWPKKGAIPCPKLKNVR